MIDSFNSRLNWLVLLFFQNWWFERISLSTWGTRPLVFFNRKKWDDINLFLFCKTYHRCVYCLFHWEREWKNDGGPQLLRIGLNKTTFSLGRMQDCKTISVIDFLPIFLGCFLEFFKEKCPLYDFPPSSQILDSKHMFDFPHRFTRQIILRKVSQLRRSRTGLSVHKVGL